MSSLVLNQKLYAIRKKGTDLYLPEPVGRMGRGGSHVEPIHVDTGVIRTFNSMRSANAALTQWLRGKHLPVMGGEYLDEYNGRWISYQEGTEVVHQPERNKDEMEIVTIHLSVTS